MLTSSVTAQVVRQQPVARSEFVQQLEAEEEESLPGDGLQEDPSCGTCSHLASTHQISTLCNCSVTEASARKALLSMQADSGKDIMHALVRRADWAVLCNGGSESCMMSPELL